MFMMACSLEILLLVIMLIVGLDLALNLLTEVRLERYWLASVFWLVLIVLLLAI